MLKLNKNIVVNTLPTLRQLTLSTAMSLSWSKPTTLALYSVPPMKVTWMSLASVMTW